MLGFINNFIVLKTRRIKKNGVYDYFSANYD